MREFVKAVNSYSLATFFFGLKEMQNMLTPAHGGGERASATHALEAITDATEEQFGPMLDSTFKTMDALQRWATDATLLMTFPIMMVLGESPRASHNGRSHNAEADDSESHRKAPAKAAKHADAQHGHKKHKAHMSESRTRARA